MLPDVTLPPAFVHFVCGLRRGIDFEPGQQWVDGLAAATRAQLPYMDPSQLARLVVQV